MAARLTANRYGKSAVRLVAVERDGERHGLRDLTVEIRLSGDFEAAYRDGDNRRVYPTDSMKNSVYALARRDGVGALEAFARRLAEHFLSRSSAPSAAEVAVSERPWSRVEVSGRPHPHAFVGGSEERRTARVELSEAGARGESGIVDLVVLKTTDSGFADFARDELTTLRSTDDRILATAVEARWSYGGSAVDFDAAWREVRRHLVEAFAGHRSRSVQHTLHAMGERVLAEVAAVEEIQLRMPNLHHLLVDLSPFGMDNPNQVFVATAEPFGVIEGTLRRG